MYRGMLRLQHHVASLVAHGPEELADCQFAPTFWVVDDVIRLRPEMSREEAAVFLHRVELQLHERVSKFGDRALASFLKDADRRTPK